jgi:hypothetical protein
MADRTEFELAIPLVGLSLFVRANLAGNTHFDQEPQAPENKFALPLRSTSQSDANRKGTAQWAAREIRPEIPHGPRAEILRITSTKPNLAFWAENAAIRGLR